MNSPFKPGDVVIIAPNDAPGDCCQGKQGRIMQGYKRGGWLIQTDHFCSIPRQEADLSLVPPEELARQYFDIEGWDVIEADGKLKVLQKVLGVSMVVDFEAGDADIKRNDN